MKRIFIGLLAASMLMACNQSTSKTSADGTVANVANEATMKFDKDLYDFGKIKVGDKVSHTFSFTNTGNLPLIITDAVASCGCTTPEWPKQPVKPGEKGEIKVTFNSAGKKGRQDKLITITSNTMPPQCVVHMVGEVVESK